MRRAFSIGAWLSIPVTACAVILGCTNPPAGQEAKGTPSVLPDKLVPAPSPSPTDHAGADPAQPAPPGPATAAPEGAAAAAARVEPGSAKAAAGVVAAAPASAVPSAEAQASAAATPSAAPSAVVAVAPSASAAADEGKAAMSAKTTEPSYNLWMQSAGKYKAGQQSAVQVVLVAKGKFHCNDKYPYKFKAGAPPAGVSYPAPVVRAEGISITPDRSIMSIPILPSAPGDARVGGTFYFSVCSAETCQVESRELSLNVKVD